MSVCFLLFHTPDPRCLKNAIISSENNKTKIICCKRTKESAFPFNVQQKIDVTCIDVGNINKNNFTKIFNLIRYMIKAYNELRKYKPNLIQVEGLHMLLLGYIFAKFNKKVVLIYEVLDLHKVIYNSDRKLKFKIIRKFLIVLEKFLVKKISKIILTSEFHWQDYYSKFIPENKYIFLPNAPFKSQFENYKKIKKNKLTIGFIGSIRYRNELINIIDIVKADKDIELLIAGGGNTDDFNFIRDYVKGANNITFYGAYNYQEEIVNLYQRIDVVYSVYDSTINNVKIAIPNKYYEAIVCELPIIAAKSTKLSYLIEKNGIGFSVNHNDKKELLNLVNKLKQDKSIISKIEKNCQKLKEISFFDNYITRLISLYNYQG